MAIKHCRLKFLGYLLIFPFLTLAMGPLYIINYTLGLIQPYVYLYIPRLIFGIRTVLYLPLILTTVAAYKIGYTTPYTRKMAVKRAEADKKIDDSPTPIVIVDTVPRRKLTFWQKLGFIRILLRLLTEFGDGIVSCLYETMLGRSRKLDLTDENMEFLFSHSAYNNIFDPVARQERGEYFVDLLVYDTYRWEEGYYGRGCRGIFDKTDKGTFKLREIQFKDGEVVRPNDKKWKIAKLHFIVCANNEMLFNLHANEHLCMMLTGYVVDELKNTRCGRILSPHFRYLPALDENIMNTLYTPDAPIFPTALHVDDIIACYNRGKPDIRGITTFRKTYYVDCPYREFESESYNFIRDFTQGVAEREYEDPSMREFYEKVVATVYEQVTVPYSKEALGDLLAFFCSEIFIFTDSEHYQVRKMGYYKSTMKTIHPFDDSPVHGKNLEYLMDAFQRILFRVVFSGDFPTDPVYCTPILGKSNNKYFDRKRLQEICKKYPDYVCYEKLSAVLDY
jgi:hypothetical protein